MEDVCFHYLKISKTYLSNAVSEKPASRYHLVYVRNGSCPDQFGQTPGNFFCQLVICRLGAGC